MSVIRLLLADVDGTLLTTDKRLTRRARVAVEELREAKMALAITSGRPPRGMKMLIEPLGLTTPTAAFNGGMLVNPDLSLIEEQALPASITRQVVAILARRDLDVWLYRGADWLVRSPHAPHVAHEQETVCFAPTVVDDFDEVGERVVKIVGVSDAPARIARCEEDLRGALGDQVSAARSQPYYLDITHPDANKGAVVTRLSAMLGIAPSEIATLGDMPTDILMFRRGGLSIAMGNASVAVQRAALHVSTSNDEEGFANAVERYVLPSTRPR